MRRSAGLVFNEKNALKPLYEKLALVFAFYCWCELEFSNLRVEHSIMTPALRFSTVSLLTPLLLLLRQSKAFLLPNGQALRAAGLSSYERAATAVAPVSPCRSKYLGLQQRTQYAVVAVAEAATAPAHQRRGIWRKERRLSMMSAGGGSTAGDIDAGGDVRKVCACCSMGAMWKNRCSTAAALSST